MMPEYHVYIINAILLIFASIGLLCTTKHIFNWCERNCCRKEIRFIRNENENINPIV